jgi:ATP synthase subunit 6
MLLIGVHMHGLSFFSNFFPSKVPYILAPFLMFVELMSYVIRILSLALRLSANIVAGHILLDTTSVFFYYICATAATSLSVCTLVTSIFLLMLIICLTLFEFIIAIVQAYIFVVLSIIYLNDSLHLHV